MTQTVDISEEQKATEAAAVAAERIPLESALVERLLRHVTVSDGRAKLAIRAPFTGEVLGEVPLCNDDDVAVAAAEARAAQAAWAATPVKARARVFLRLHDIVLDRRNEVLDLIQLESGKARAHAVEEVLDTAITARYYSHVAPGVLGSTRRQGALPVLTTTYEYHHPRGLVGFIAPWNYPLTLAITDAIPALLAGNAVLLKPDRQTPFTALWAVDALYEAGLPTGLLKVVTGKGAELGTPIIENVDYVCFTGSTATGRVVAAQAGERLIGCSLELGGKNPMIVLPDADLGKAVDGAVRGCYASAGQLCISIERLYVHESLYDEFVSRFGAKVREMKVGPGFGFDVDMGSLVSKSQLQTVTEHVDDARKKGATVVAGGRARPDLGPLFYEPTVLAGVTQSMKLYSDETFGPVVSVYSFSNVEEALGRANDTCYGLNASVWTSDLAAGRRLAAKVQAGTVNVNESYAATWASIDAPMGGFKDSGLSRRHGADGILKYTEAQTVAVERFFPVTDLPGLTGERYASVMSFALKLLKRVPGYK